MTIDGAVNKTIFLFFLMMITTSISFIMPTMFLLYVGGIGGLIAVLIAVFKPQWSPTIAPGYALFESLFLGTVSFFFMDQFYEGIVYQAVGLTMGTLLTMLLVYKSGLIKVTQKFRMGVVMATGAIFIVYMISWVGSIFGFQLPFLHEGGMMGIGISLVIIGVAALNLLLDFDLFEKGEQYKAPKYMEWYAAMSLLITLVWLYVEFLRLLSKLNRD
jgi:uncharacterized YccA/Bax inhibitor family protein